MKRVDRLVLDALANGEERSAPEIHAYVHARRWTCLSSIYVALFRLDTAGLVRSEFVPGPFPRKRLYRKVI